MLFLLTGCLLTACIEDDFSTSPSDRLTFSTDTLSFDTVFTGQGTPTARLKVYNRAKKSLNISTIHMAKSTSLFSMNVDGQSGRTFSDIEIRGGDSIMIFVECLIPEGTTPQPTLAEDAIVFMTNGQQQKVVLEAWGQNVRRLRSLRLTSDMHMTAEMPYVVYDSLIVEPTATLTIDPGTQVLFHDKASLTVRGRLLALGVPGKMIDMRGDRLDDVLPDTEYDILAGQWHGISIAPESFGNRMEYVNMRSTVQGLVVDSTAATSTQKLLLLNSWLHNSQGNVLTSKYAWVDALGCVFSEAAQNVVSITGGQHTFTQCTIANYYLFSGSWPSMLGLFHCLPDSEQNQQPLMSARFNNCIIYGLASPLNIGDLKDTDVYMRNVLFGTEGTDDEHFIECIWDADPLFYTVRQDYYFNYRVNEDSPAIGAGNPAYVTTLCLTDMDGINRLSEGNPTLGAFQYVPPKEEPYRRRQKGL